MDWNEPTRVIEVADDPVRRRRRQAGSAKRAPDSCRRLQQTGATSTVDLAVKDAAGTYRTCGRFQSGRRVVQHDNGVGCAMVWQCRCDATREAEVGEHIGKPRCRAEDDEILEARASGRRRQQKSPVGAAEQPIALRRSGIRSAYHCGPHID